MHFSDFETIAEFLEENEDALTQFLDGDDAKAARLINDFQVFISDAATAGDLVWQPTDDEGEDDFAE